MQQDQPICRTGRVEMYRAQWWNTIPGNVPDPVTDTVNVTVNDADTAHPTTRERG